MPMFPDGTVVPSGFSPRPMGLPSDMGLLSDTRLRYGEVKEIIYPGDPRSISKQVNEYRVMVEYRDASGATVFTEYNHVPIQNLFGGLADYFKYTLRPDTSGKPGPGVGSRVLMACLNGEATRAVILGGMSDQVPADQQSDGHNLQLQFNGTLLAIDKDGAFDIVFGGATGPDGKLLQGVKASDGGTYLSMSKDGSLDLGNGNEHLKFDHQNNTAKLFADQDIDVTSNHSRIAMHADTGIFMDTVKSGATFHVTTDGNQILESNTGVLIGSPNAQQALIMGTRFRTDLTTQNQQLLSALVMGLTAVTAAQALCSAIGVAIVVPITGAIATAPMHAALAVQLGLLGQALNRMGSAISNMEGVASTHTSTKNFTD